MSHRAVVIGIAATALAATLPAPVAWGAGASAGSVAAPALTGSPTVELGQTAGGTFAIAARDGLVAFGEGSRLTIADASDPANVHVLGQSPPLGDLVVAVALAGPQAYVAAGAGGLAVLDLSAPDAPALLSATALSAPVLDVSIVGETAFLAAGEAGLVAVDVSAADRPVVLGSLAVDGSARSVAVSSPYAYLVATTKLAVGDLTYWRHQVSVIDVRSPRSPALVDSFPGDVTADEASPTALVDGLLVIGGDLRLSVYELSDPAHPAAIGELGFYAPVKDVTTGFTAHTALVGWGDVHPTGGRVTEVDLIQPARPLAALSWGASEYAPPFVASDAQAAYATREEGGFAVLGERPGEPPTPEYRGALRTTGMPMAVALGGDLAFVATRGSGTSIVDVSDPSDPRVLGRSTATGGGPLILFADIAVPASSAHEAPTYVYVASGSGDVVRGTLLVTDVSDPAAPKAVGGYGITGDWAYSVAVTDTVAYLGHHGAIDVVSVSEPFTPTLLQSIPVPGDAMDLAVVGDVLYATGLQLDVDTYDIGDPRQPRHLGRLGQPGLGTGVAVSDGVAYVVWDVHLDNGREICEPCALDAIDVGTPSAPRLLERVELPGLPLSVSTDGDRVIVGVRSVDYALTGGEVLTFDVGQAGALALANRTRLSGLPRGLVGRRGQVIVAGEVGGLSVLGAGCSLFLPQLGRLAER